MTLIARLSAALTLSASLAALCLLVVPSAASASKGQIDMIQDTVSLLHDPVGTLDQFRALGANTVRVVVFWDQIAPSPRSKKEPKFSATNPSAYPAANWAPYDEIVRDAKQAGITVDFTVAGGAPRWAQASGAPSYNPQFTWKPNAKLYGQFMHAVGDRYDGHFKPKGASSALPAVRFWALWNEPNFGEDLGPQAIKGSTVSIAPTYYRSLVNQGYDALHQTGHGHDKILIGEFAARGMSGKASHKYPQGFPGNYGLTKPLQFIRTLYCLDNNYRQLRGGAAKARGCPTNAAGSRKFRKQNPGLFNASGVGDHPYPGGGSPVTDGKYDKDFAAFPDLGRLEAALDHVNRTYGSGKHYSIYNDEYGYITNPPNKRPVQGGGHYVSPATAAYYINWAEYLSWKSGRVASYMQYLLSDPAPTSGVYAGFASGLYFFNGSPKPSLDSYRLPLYMPKTSFSHNKSVELWGDVRPGNFAKTAGRQAVAIQFQTGGRGAYSTIATERSNGYFDIHTKFPSSGNIRLSYTYPRSELLLPVGVAGSTVTSRVINIKVS